MATQADVSLDAFARRLNRKYRGKPISWFKIALYRIAPGVRPDGNITVDLSVAAHRLRVTVGTIYRWLRCGLPQHRCTQLAELARVPADLIQRG